MISYVLSDCHLSGGARVVFEHVNGLTERGHDAQLLYRTGSPHWFRPAVPSRRINPSDLASIRGIKVATWCGTAPWVAESLRDDDKGFYLVQDLDEWTYHKLEPVTYWLGLSHIVEGRWVEKQLRESFSEYSDEPTWVGIGTRYAGVPMQRERFRVFAQHVPRGPHQSGDLKGWGKTVETMKLVHQFESKASIVTFGRKRDPMLRPIPHIHIRQPSDAKLAELYSQAGVMLFTSQHEGFGLPALESMACGLPVVCTNADSNMEFCINGETAIVCETPLELAEACILVMNDDALWAKLSMNGLAMAEQYRWPAVIDRLEKLYA